MNLYESQGHRDTAHEQLFNIFNQQRSAFNALPYPDLDSRRSKLFKLKSKLFVIKMSSPKPLIPTLVLDQSMNQNCSIYLVLF
jgi:hypothetical protein